MLERPRANANANFAMELAEEFSRRFPPQAPRDGASAKAFGRAVDDLCARARAFQRETKPGLYGKAKFGMEFKHKLKDMGYAEALADELTHTLLIRMSAE